MQSYKQDGGIAEEMDYSWWLVEQDAMKLKMKISLNLLEAPILKLYSTYTISYRYIYHTAT